MITQKLTTEEVQELINEKINLEILLGECE